MNAKSAINKEIFAPHDERMLGAVQVKRRTKKKIPFLATGGQGEYLTYICLSDIVIFLNACSHGPVKHLDAEVSQLLVGDVAESSLNF
uniref:Syntaxin binding protein 6 n=1 Tax=Meleagris gallopavo TaxID=9103 RepID=A0A803YN69_MELGA